MKKVQELMEIIWTTIKIFLGCIIILGSITALLIFCCRKLQEGLCDVVEIVVYTSDNLRNSINKEQEKRMEMYYLNELLDFVKKKCIEAILTENYETSSTCLEEANTYLTICTRILYESGFEDKDLINTYIQVYDLYHESYIYVKVKATN